ncbi:type II toxin-antitoxin system PemK/MazF family toxin [Listeria immobilis]|uniref:type II toxin-antitoxin system PemK/MazF family toxin n=1 Tax=Listeria immobilis TaxID=2713502 RepID=UPI0016275865|nr:type II toxin-antitoxin system PemK/MazF family toxin [Listeria immobilis]MBC1517171.1 type II toxin-antitoxin system PemK/MazF family toxin [Listeria immobilis]MBC6298309.1 type II toxin-antitoxin system PemK/MazF family toxin [Listeria immobilis]
MVRQGDIIKINLNPKKGHEQQGYRPYICLSHHLVSDYANIAIFAPISNTLRSYPLYVPLKGTETTGKVLLDQLITIDYNARQYNYIETVSDPFLTKLLETVKVIFQKNENQPTENLH